MRAYLGVGLLCLAGCAGQPEGNRPEPQDAQDEESKSTNELVTFVRLSDEDDRRFPEDYRPFFLEGNTLKVPRPDGTYEAVNNETLVYALDAGQTESVVIVLLEWTEPSKDETALKEALERLRKHADRRVRTVIYYQYVLPTAPTPEE
jgi:hypothetical protein